MLGGWTCSSGKINTIISEEKVRYARRAFSNGYAMQRPSLTGLLEKTTDDLGVKKKKIRGKWIPLPQSSLRNNKIRRLTIDEKE